MTFVFLLPDLLSGIHPWIGAMLLWLGELRGMAGAVFGVVLLLAMAAAVAVAVWQAVYRTVVVWLRAR